MIYLAAVMKAVLSEYHKYQPNMKVNCLYTFGNPKSYQLHKLPELKSAINSIICDSGTYAKNAKSKIGINITLESFMDMCKEPSSNIFDYIFNYDENHFNTGFKSNLKNIKRCEEQGIRVVPIAHDYIGKKEINYYIKEKYEIIGLGASKDKNGNDLKTKKNIINAANRILDADVKVHLLGVTDYSILIEIPFTFCDSSTWAREGIKYLFWWNPEENKIDRIYMLDRIDSEETNREHIENYRYKKQFYEYIDVNFDMDISDLMGYRMHFYRSIVNMHFFVKLEDIIRKEHRQRGFKID